MNFFFLVLGFLFLVEDANAVLGGKLTKELTPAVPTIVNGKLTKVAFAFKVDADQAATNSIEFNLNKQTGSLDATMTDELVDSVAYRCATAPLNSEMVTLGVGKETMLTAEGTAKEVYWLKGTHTATKHIIQFINGKTGPNATWGKKANVCVVHVTFKSGLVSVGAKGLVDGSITLKTAAANTNSDALCLGIGTNPEISITSALCSKGANSQKHQPAITNTNPYESGNLTFDLETANAQVSNLCVGGNAISFLNCFTGYNVPDSSSNQWVGKVTYKDDVFVTTTVGVVECSAVAISVDCTSKSCTLVYSASDTKAAAANPKPVCAVVQAGKGSKSNVGVYRGMSVYAGDVSIAAFKSATQDTTTPEFANAYGPAITSSVEYSDIQATLTTLKTDVAKIPTEANSSASIVPLFLLGVFGSVFALTM